MCGYEYKKIAYINFIRKEMRLRNRWKFLAKPQSSAKNGRIPLHHLS